jgi:hypothetical protein
LDPAFADRHINTVAVVPVIDRRTDPSAGLDLQQQIGARAKKHLRKRGYKVIDAVALPGDNAEAQVRLADLDAAYLASRAPSGADAVFAIAVDDVMSSYKVLSYAFKIEATGTLVSVADRKELWRGRGIGNMGQGGLVSGLLIGLNRMEALDTCVGEMLSSIPRRKR